MLENKKHPILGCGWRGFEAVHMDIKGFLAKVGPFNGKVVVWGDTSHDPLGSAWNFELYWPSLPDMNFVGCVDGLGDMEHKRTNGFELNIA